MELSPQSLLCLKHRNRQSWLGLQYDGFLEEVLGPQILLPHLPASVEASWAPVLEEHRLSYLPVQQSLLPVPQLLQALPLRKTIAKQSRLQPFAYLSLTPTTNTVCGHLGQDFHGQTLSDHGHAGPSATLYGPTLQDPKCSRFLWVHRNHSIHQAHETKPRLCGTAVLKIWTVPTLFSA